MEEKQKYPINISAPNLLNICIDEMVHGEIRGRMFHCYADEPIVFANVVELIKNAEDFFDAIAFPQASTQSRSFKEKTVTKQYPPLKKVCGYEDIVCQRGELGSFITNVKFRQNSTWQGEIFWIEGEEKGIFTNSLDFVKLVDQALVRCTENK